MWLSLSKMMKSLLLSFLDGVGNLLPPSRNKYWHVGGQYRRHCRPHSCQGAQCIFE